MVLAPETAFGSLMSPTTHYLIVISSVGGRIIASRGLSFRQTIYHQDRAVATPFPPFSPGSPVLSLSLNFINFVKGYISIWESVAWVRFGWLVWCGGYAVSLTIIWCVTCVWRCVCVCVWLRKGCQKLTLVAVLGSPSRPSLSHLLNGETRIQERREVGWRWCRYERVFLDTKISLVCVCVCISLTSVVSWTQNTIQSGTAAVKPNQVAEAVLYVLYINQLDILI